MNPYIKRKIIKIQKGTSEEIKDYIAVEKKLRVTINGKNIINLYCTPIMIKELVTGLFFTEGIIKNKISYEDMKIVHGDEIAVDISIPGYIKEEELIISRCLGGFSLNKKRKFERVKNDFTITTENLKNIFNEFQKKSDLFKLTGCFHSAAISDRERILVFAEDIGRHNVVDKVIGSCILENISFTKKLMLVSCRLSSEIVSKCSKCRIPIVASRSAPTDLAVKSADLSGVTLVGFARGDSMNIYTNMQRIIQ